jgi:hypothetical protein
VKPVSKEIPQGQERAPQSSEPPFKEKEKGGRRLPCLVVNEGSLAWWSMGGEEEGSLLPIPISPSATLFDPSFYFIFYPLTLNFYFTMVLGHHLHLLFLSSAYKS